MMKKALIFSSCLVAGYASGVFAQEAAPVVAPAEPVATTAEVLFKIHDIKPNKGKDGMVQDCDYTITFYNRSATNIESASIDLSWFDNTGNYIIEQNQKNIAGSISQASEEEAKEASEDAKIVAEAKNINTFIDIPSIAAYSQISIASKIKTEKCYLLFGDVKYSVTSCDFQSQEEEENIVPISRRGNNSVEKESCARLFRFVSTQNPEYYRGFKPISYDEEQKVQEEKQIKDLQEISDKTGSIASNMNKATEVMRSVK